MIYYLSYESVFAAYRMMWSSQRKNFFLSIYLEKRSGLGLGLFLDPSAQMIG